MIFAKGYELGEVPNLREIIFLLKDYTQTEIPNLDMEIQRCLKDAVGEQSV